MKSKKQSTLRASARRQNRACGNVKPPTLTLRRILVPLDFSGKSRQALDFAVPLAEQYGGKIVLAHVVQPPAMSAWHAIPGGGHYLAMKRHNLTDAAQKRLSEMASDHVPSGVRRQTVVLRGSPGDELMAMAERLKVELIVLSTRGHTGLKRMLIGSTAERVVRHAGCPVLAVRRQGTQSRRPMTRPARKEVELPGRATPTLPWRRILVPIDFSKTSLRAFETAVPLAQDCGARLFLLNVIEPAAYASGFESVVLAVPDAALLDEAKAALPKIAKRFVPSGVKVTAVVDRGRAYDVITRVAEEEEIDLIVLTTHGRTGFDHLMMGSTAERVVRHAHCPVYVVRSFAQGQRERERKERKR